jgi:hypothetical protein
MSVKQQHEHFDPDITLVALNLQEHVDEDLEEKVNEMISVGIGLSDISVARVMRLKGRDGRCGVVKIQCYNKNDKIAILKAKQNLKDVRIYKNVYIRSAMTHVERLVKLNFETLLREVPGGHKYRIAGNGRIIPRNEDVEQATNTDDANRNRDSGRNSFPIRGNRGRRGSWRGSGPRRDIPSD